MDSKGSASNQNNPENKTEKESPKNDKVAATDNTDSKGKESTASVSSPSPIKDEDALRLLAQEAERAAIEGRKEEAYWDALVEKIQLAQLGPTTNPSPSLPTPPDGAKTDSGEQTSATNGQTAPPAPPLVSLELHDAAKRGQLRRVWELLEEGADPNLPNPNGTLLLLLLLLLLPSPLQLTLLTKSLLTLNHIHVNTYIRWHCRLNTTTFCLYWGEFKSSSIVIEEGFSRRGQERARSDPPALCQ